MTVRAAKFTPDVLLEAPRRSSGSPNSIGTLVLYSISTYSFEKHERTSELRVLDLEKNESHIISDSKNASSAKWLSDDTIAVLEPDKGATNIVIGSVNDFEKT
jgi:hypothetical protein